MNKTPDRIAQGWKDSFSLTVQRSFEAGKAWCNTAVSHLVVEQEAEPVSVASNVECAATFRECPSSATLSGLATGLEILNPVRLSMKSNDPRRCTQIHCNYKTLENVI